MKCFLPAMFSIPSVEPSRGSFGSGATDFLDLLATVASRELKKEMQIEEAKPLMKPSSRLPRRMRRLDDYDEFDVAHLLRMTQPTLLRMFAEQDFDELTRRFKYVCALMPHLCSYSALSFGSETKAKGEMKRHLSEHVKTISERPKDFEGFTAESVPARKRRMVEGASALAKRRASLDDQDSTVGSSKERKKSKSPVENKADLVVDHDYCLTFGQESLGKESDISADTNDGEEQAKGELEGWIKAVADSKCRDVERLEDDSSNGGDFSGFVFPEPCISGSVLQVTPVIGSEVAIMDETPQKRRREPRKHVRSSLVDRVTNENLSPEDARERQLALQAIEDLKVAGHSMEDFQCRLCGKHLSAFSTLLNHLRSHAGVRPFGCKLCGALFTRQHSLNYHMLIHRDETRFTCDVCGKGFRHPSHYKEHRLRHAGQLPFECQECMIKYKSRNTYKRHLKIFHGKAFTPSGSLKSLTPDESARIRQQELQKEQNRLERRRKKQQVQEPEALRPSSVIDDFANEGDDEEVAQLSKQLAEDETMLEGRTKLGGSGSSEEGSYYPSTDSEFSSPDVTSQSAAAMDVAGPQQTLVEFDSSPPANVRSTPPKNLSVNLNGERPVAPLTPLKNQGTLPNLLDSGSSSAFNPIKQEQKKKTTKSDPETTPAINEEEVKKSDAFPPAIVGGNGVKFLPSAGIVSGKAALLADVKGQKMLLVPQLDQDVKSSATAAMSQSKLEQCLRYGSAAAMKNNCTEEVVLDVPKQLA